jgi:hypothetical protein
VRAVGCRHRRTRVRHAFTNGKAERCVPTGKDPLEDLLRRKFDRTIAELPADLDERIAWRDTPRPQRGRHNRGRSPVVVIDTFRTAKEEIGAAWRKFP